MAELAGGKALDRPLRKLLEFLRMDPDGSGRECHLHQQAISNRKDDAVLSGGHAPDTLARRQSRPSHTLPASSPAIAADDQNRTPYRNLRNRVRTACNSHSI